jgi:hypothetical protein
MRVLDFGGERTLRSIGREFEDRVLLWFCHKQIALAVKGHVTGMGADRYQHCCQAGNCKGDKESI